MSDITSAQLRAARALVRWRADDLALHSKVGVATIRRAEGSEGVITMTVANQAAIRGALEAAGVIFVAENGEGAGVRLRKAPAAQAATEADMQASAAVVRSQAALVVDEALSEVDATREKKADRRGALTDEPAVIDEARGKGNRG